MWGTSGGVGTGGSRSASYRVRRAGSCLMFSYKIANCIASRYRVSTVSTRLRSLWRRNSPRQK